MKITAAQINPPIHQALLSPFSPLPTVIVTYEDDTTENLFNFYPDEITFTADEFIGLTREEATQLRHDRDVAYLRS